MQYEFNIVFVMQGGVHLRRNSRRVIYLQNYPFILETANIGKLPVLRSAQVKTPEDTWENVGGPEKLLYIIMFDIIKKSCHNVFSVR